MLKKLAFIMAALLTLESVQPALVNIAYANENETLAESDAEETEAAEASESEEIISIKEAAADRADDFTGLVPVYANTSDESFGDEGEYIIGYAKLDNESRTAEYYYALGDSHSPTTYDSIRVPRRIILVNQYGGQRLYDYTEGYYLDAEGYATEIQGGERIQNEAGEPIIDAEGNVTYPPIYVGKAYDVTALNRDVFKSVDLHRDMVITLKIPRTIENEITYDYFSELPYLADLSVYNAGAYDEYNVLTEQITSFRYITDTKNVTNSTGVDKSYTSGVLVDTLCRVDNSVAKIVFCPPDYHFSTYNYWYSTRMSNAVAGGTYRIIIGPHAFENCKNIERIFPENSSGVIPVISQIGYQAFKNCKKLNTAEVFSTFMQKIEDEAFSGCEDLESVSFNPTEGTTLGNRIFEGTNISKLEIPVGYNQMTGETFKDMDALRSIETVAGFPTSATAENLYYKSRDGVLYRFNEPGRDAKLENGAELVRYPSLLVTEAKKPNSMDAVKTKSFEVPYFVTDFDEYSFYNCTSLVNMYFPSTITDIGMNVFYGCTSLSNMYFYSGLIDLSIPEERYASDYLFPACRTYINVYAGTNTPAYAYAQANHGAPNRMVPNPLYDSSAYSFDLDPVNKTATLLKYNSGVDTTGNNIIIPNYVISNDIRYVVTGAASASLADVKITSVYFLHDMKDVAEDAFYYVRNREDIEDPNNINAVSLENIYVEKGNNSLYTDEGVLYRQKYDPVTQSYVPSEMLYYPAGNIGETYTAIKGLEAIPEYAFWGAANLRNVNIYDSIQEIGYNALADETDESTAFAGCKNLVKVNIIPDPDTKSINVRYYSDNGVLYNWDSNAGPDGNGAPLKLVYFPRGRREMDIDDTSHVSYVVVDGCEEIKNARDCIFLGSIFLPKSVKKIDDNAFEGCIALTNVEFLTEGEGEGIESIGVEAFKDTALASLKLPESIKTVGSKAFYNCYAMQEIYIEGDNLISIGDSAFYRDSSSEGVSALQSVTITGTKDNRSGANLTIGDSAFRGSAALIDVTITNMGNTYIGKNAFRDCSLLKNMDFKDTDILEIDQRAFQNCNGFVSLDLTNCEKLMSISDYAFYSCRGLNSIKLPGDIEEIGDYAFKNCINLDEINFSELDDLNIIGYQSFANTGFISLVLPPNLRTIKDSAFYGSQLLSTIYVPESVNFQDETGSYYSYNGAGPFYNMGESVYVYGVNNSDVDYYLQYMHEMEYPAPTFVGSEELPVALVDLKQSEIEVYNVGDIYPQLTAVVSSVDDLKDYGVSWYAVDPSICQIIDESFDSINTSTCRVKGLKVGTTKVYAVNRQTGGSDYCIVTVKNAQIETNPTDTTEDSNTITVGGLTVTKNIILNSRGSNKKASINAVSDPARKVYFKSHNNKIARVSRDGTVTGRKAGTTTIVAYAGERDTYVEAEINVTVFRPEIALSKKKIILNARGEDSSKTQAHITVTHSGAYSDVKWESSNPAICSVTGDNEGAVITGNPQGRGGKVVITAYCNGIKAKCKVVVMPCSLSLDTEALVLYTGTLSSEIYRLKARTKGLETNVRWTSSNDDVATVDNTGLVKAVSEGQAKITAYANGTEKTCTVTVKKSYVKLYGSTAGDSQDEKTRVVINKTGNNTYQFRARVVGREDAVSWKSLAPNIFTVSKEGLITGKSGGTADLVVSANGEEAICQVTVVDNYTMVDIPEMTLYLDGLESESWFSLTAMIQGADPAKALTWEVEDEGIISLNNAFKYASLESSGYTGNGTCDVIAVKEGTTRIKVTANGVSAYCRVTVRR